MHFRLKMKLLEPLLVVPLLLWAANCLPDDGNEANPYAANVSAEVDQYHEVQNDFGRTIGEAHAQVAWVRAIDADNFDEIFQLPEERLSAYLCTLSPVQLLQLKRRALRENASEDILTRLDEGLALSKSTILENLACTVLLSRLALLASGAYLSGVALEGDAGLAPWLFFATAAIAWPPIEAYNFLIKPGFERRLIQSLKSLSKNYQFSELTRNELRSRSSCRKAMAKFGVGI